MWTLSSCEASLMLQHRCNNAGIKECRLLCVEQSILPILLAIQRNFESESKL